jgi:hypothetical protein
MTGWFWARILMMITLVAMSTSCALTPKQLTERGEEFCYLASGSPTETAWCMGRAAEERATLWRPSVRPLGSDGTIELLIQVISGGESTAVLVAHLQPISKGSEVTLWLTRQPLYQGRDEFREAVVGGCSMKHR